MPLQVDCMIAYCTIPAPQLENIPQ